MQRAFILFLFSCLASFGIQTTAEAAVTGSISGTVTDVSGLVIPGAKVTLHNTAQGIDTKAITDAKGEYSIPSLAVGSYDLLCEAEGFRSEKRTGLTVDTNAVIVQNLTLQIAEQSSAVTVSDTTAAAEVHVETASTQLGDVVSGTQMTEVALNGRSFTDLLALQPGIVPVTTQLPDSIVMAGASVAIPPRAD